MPAKCAAPRATAHLSQEYRTPAWEQRKLGEVASGFEYGLNAAASDFDGEKKYLRITDIDDQTREFRTDDLSSPDINNPIDDRYLLKEGDILFARTGASVGKTYLYKASDGKTYYAGFLIRAHVSDEADAGFIFQSTLTERYKQFVLLTSQRSGQPGINAQEYSDLLLPLPSLMEQRRIGAFFDRLDSLITLHQRKYDKLCVLKKSMLDKMFPKGGSLYPEIRFAGFTDPWEQRKLGEVARRVTRKNENGDSDLPLTISAQYGLVDQRTFFNSQVASKDMSGYFLLHRGEFAYNKSTSTDSPWGAIKRLEKYDMGCVSTLYICFELLSGDPDFLVTYYETDRWYKSVQLIAAEGARNHGLLNIAPDDFFETQICIPKRIDEQRRIGAFFDRLDSLITLHQRKYDGCANPLFLERRISCRKPSHQNRCSATTTPSG